ncbi:MAG: helix-turn-helix domain-containing protein [Pseudonocardiaceae bacterium]
MLGASASYGVSRRTLHTWLTRYARDGLAGLMDRTTSHPPARTRPAPRWRSPSVRATPGTSPLGPRRIATSWPGAPRRPAPRRRSTSPGKSMVHLILRGEGNAGRIGAGERETPMALWQ